MSTYIYARVSTFDQYVNGYSIDQQIRVCLDHVKANGFVLGTETNCDLPGVFVDGGKSAYTKKLIQRPGGLRLMETLQTGDTVVTLATHRLFRRFSDMVQTMEHWVEKGITVRFTDYPMLNTDTANGKAMLYVMAVMAQLKSELISSRVKESHQIAKCKAEIKEAKVYKPVIETSSKDLGAIMQQIAVNRESKAYKFTGKVRAYVRVSTKDQTVEHQIEQITRAVPYDLQGAEIEWYKDEGASAFKTRFEKRKAGGKLLTDLQPGDMVIAWRPDRLFRSLIDTHRVMTQIHDKGASVMTVEGNMRTDTPQGRIMFQMLGMFAEIESQDISRLTKLGQFGAIGVNPAARKMRMPKFLREMEDHHRQKHFQFNHFFTKEERFCMYVEMTLTQKNYRDRRTACRVISNKYLKRKGFPQLNGEYGELAKVYLNRVKAMQKEEFSARRQRLIDVLSELDKQEEIRHPINVTTIAWTDKRQEEFLKVAKTIPGRLRDKQGLTMMAESCSRPEQAVELFRNLG